MEAGDTLHHFVVTVLDGQQVAYKAIWQRKSIVLAVLAPENADYAPSLQNRRPDISNRDAELVITGEAVPGLSRPAVVIADRWGEVVFVSQPAGTSDLPGVDEVLAWLDHVQRQCPECEGEAQ